MTTKTYPNRTISILFVEDDELILELQASVLRVKFPDVVFYTAVNGRIGLELFKIHRTDIVITDINMPELCGVQMSGSIHAIKPETMFIAISGKSENSYRPNSANKVFKFDHVIVKPVDLSNLFAIIEQCLGEVSQRAS